MPSYVSINEASEILREFRLRLLLLLVAIFLLSAVLVLRYYHLQVTEHDKYLTRADDNRIHTRSVAPRRGLILDTHGVVLAENMPGFTLEVVTEKAGDLENLLTEIGKVMPVSEEDRERFHERVKRKQRPFEGVPLLFNLDDEDVARIAVHEYRWPGVEVQAQLFRHYPYADYFAHAVGYVGKINARELQAFDKQGFSAAYDGVYVTGKTGVEKYYESVLLGQVGVQYVETDARGRVLRVLDQKDPVPGTNLQLFLDIDLQQIAFEQLSGKRGAIVALDVQTGGVLVAASTPAFDPNLFVRGISHDDYGKLRDSWKTPLFDRVVQGQYPPGSTLKPMIGLAGLESGVINAYETVPDPGFYQLPGEEHKYRDWKKGGHGHGVNLKKAVAESCDTYFYELSYRLGVDRLSPFLGQFGLGKKTGVDLPSERPGLLPDRDWKLAVRGLPWFPGDTLNIGIGQGDMLATPMQLAYATAIVANSGKRIRPRMVKAVGDVPTSPQREPDILLREESEWETIHKTMEEVMHGVKGTARRSAEGASYRMAGKTGTAQVIGIKQGETYDAEQLATIHLDHALFVGYAPADKPEVAVAVVVENGEHGSSTAAPMARAIFDHFLEMKRP